MMIRALKRSHFHFLGHVSIAQLYPSDLSLLVQESEKANDVRQQIKSRIEDCGNETMEYGIELDTRYNSPIVYGDGSPEPITDVKRYIPNTRPGSRVPHVFLKDGKTSTYDLFGKEWTLFHFTNSNNGGYLDSDIFVSVAEKLKVPLTRVVLDEEEHVRRIWGCDLILVRPDNHVAWRSTRSPEDESTIEEIIKVVTGHQSFVGFVQPNNDNQDDIGEIARSFG